MKAFWVNALDLHEFPTDSRDVLVVLENEAQSELLQKHNRIVFLENKLMELKETLKSHCADNIQVSEDP